MRSVDAVRLQLIRSGLTSIVDEMCLAIVRTARSSAVKEQMDFTTAVCDADGRVVAQGICIALHLGTLPDVMRAVLDAFPDLGRGDVVIVNDPYSGGTHLPDIYMVRPIFVQGDRFAYGVVNMHHVDVGGRVAGSVAPDSTEVFQEGLRIPPLLYRAGGALDSALRSLIVSNVRLPEVLLGDLEAQENACALADMRVNELVLRYGAETLREYMDHLLDYAERMARAEIAAMPDGRFSFVDHLDDDGVGSEPVRIEVSVHIRGDELTVDFEGCSPQVRGALNVAIPMTRSACFCCVRAIMGSNIPDNEGFSRPIGVRAPSGSIVNPLFPAAVGARGATVHRLCDAVFGALAQAVPDRVMGADEGGSTNIGIGGRRTDGTPFVHVEFMYGNWGGRKGLDGVDGASNIFSNMANIPVEVVEAQLPIEVLRYGFVANTGGAGRYRGGLSMTRELRLTSGTATLTVRSDRSRFRPYGLLGGRAGAASRNVLRPGGGDPKELTTKFTIPFSENDVFLHVQAGAGGYGDPLEREPRAVAADVEDEKIDCAHADADYAVIIDPVTFAVDSAATALARAARARNPLAAS